MFSLLVGSLKHFEPRQVGQGVKISGEFTRRPCGLRGSGVWVAIDSAPQGPHDTFLVRFAGDRWSRSVSLSHKHILIGELLRAGLERSKRSQARHPRPGFLHPQGLNSKSNPVALKEDFQDLHTRLGGPPFSHPRSEALATALWAVEAAAVAPKR